MAKYDVIEVFKAMTKYNDKKKASNKKWDDKNIKRGSYIMSIALYEEFEKYCLENDISKNKLINDCIAEKIGYTANTVKDAE